MATELDALQIRILAQDKASDTLKSLAENLNGLKKALSGINTKGIDNLANSLRSLNDLGIAKANTRVIDDVVSKFAEFNNIKPGGLAKIREELEKTFATMVEASKSGEDLSRIKFGWDLRQTIADNMAYRQSLDDVRKGIMQYIDSRNEAFKQGKQSPLGIGDLKGELGDYFNDFAKNMGVAFKKSIPGTLDSFIQNIRDEVPGADALLSENSLEAVSQLKDIIAEARNARKEVYSLNELLNGIPNSLKGTVSSEEVQATNDKIWEILDDTYKGWDSYINSFDGNSEKLNAQFSHIGDALGEISNVSFPDFSGLSGLSNFLNAISKENVDKAISNLPTLVTEINGLSAIDTGKVAELSALGDALQKFSGLKVGNLSKLTSMTGIATGDKADESMVAASEGVQNFNNNIKELEDSLRGLSESIGLKPLEEIVPSEANSRITELISKIKEYKQLISDMDSGKKAFNTDDYKEATKNLQEANKELAKLRSGAGIKDNTSTKGMLENLVVLGHEVEKLSQAFNKLGNIGMGALKIIYKPMDSVVKEVKEKVSGIISAFDNMSKAVQTKLSKMSQFWHRTMRTFTFMVVRKAITAVIQTIGEAVNSLARFSAIVGTQFNSSVSNAVADLTYMGRAILGAFEPLINVLVPILDQVANALARVMALLGQFFAALTGQSYYVKAKKNVTDYAASLDKASKSQKNLTMGIDELNILSEQSGGSSGLSNPLDEWETEDVTQKMKDFAAKIKDIFDQLLEPIKKAWDAMKEYILSGLRYMLDEIKKLAEAIGRDFLIVWKQDETVDLFKNLLGIIGDLERVIGNLAKRFREAWEAAALGLRILENIRDIIAILVDHVRNVTKYMVGWSDSLNFVPLLTGIEKVTDSLKRVADFVGGVFEDIFKNIILPYVKWFIEEGAPHTLEMISKVLDAFDFTKIREDLVPVEKAFESMLENIHTGVTEAIGNLGIAIARWTNSEEFTKFMEAIAHIMGLVTAERVEKLFTALGMAVLETAEALARFVSSEKFLDFLDGLAEWFDSLSVEELTNGIKTLATVILGFKFAAFVGEGLAGFLTFFATIQSAKNIAEIATHLSGASNGISNFGKAINNISFASIGEGFANIGEKVKALPGAFMNLHNELGLIPKTLISVVGGFSEFFLVKDGIHDLAEGTDDLLAKIAEIGTGAAIGAAAFVAAFGPAGLAMAAAIGFTAAVAGMFSGFDDARFNRLGESVKNALENPGGTSIDTLVNTVKQKISELGDGFELAAKKSSELDFAKDNVEALVFEIDKIKTSMEAGVTTVEEGSKLMAEKFDELDKAVETKIGAAANVLLATFAPGGAVAQAYGFTSEEVSKLSQHIVQNTSDQEKALADARAEMEKFPEGTEGWNKAYQDYLMIASGMDAVSASQNILSASVTSNKLDWSAYIDSNTGEIETKKISDALGEMKDQARIVLDDFDKTVDNAKQAAIEANDSETLLKIETGYPTAYANMNKKSGEEIKQFTDAVQTDLVSKTSEIMQQAAKDWEEMSPVEKLVKYGNDFGMYALELVNDYKTNYIDPVSQEVETALNELGIQGAGWGTDAMNTIMDGLFNLDEAAVASELGTAHAKEILRNDWETNLNTLGGELQGISENAAKGIQTGFALGVNTGDEAQTAIETWAQNMKAPIEALPDEMGEFGENAVDSFNEKAEPKMGESESIFQKWGRMIIQAFHDSALDFGSPSKAMEDFGVDTVEGYNKGVDDSSDSTIDSIKNWVGKITDSLSGVTDKIRDDTEKNWKEIGKAIDTSVKNIQTNTKKDWEQIGTKLTTETDTIKTKIEKSWEKIETSIRNINTEIRTACEREWENIKDRLKNNQKDMEDTTREVFKSMHKAVKNQCEKISERMTEMGVMFKDFANNNMKEWSSAWEHTWEDIKGVVSSACDEIRSMVAELVAEVEASFAGLKYNLVDDPIVIDMWDDIKDEFRTGSEESLSNVEDMTDDVLDSFNSLGDGLNIGLFDSIESSAASALSSLSDNVSDTVEDIKGMFDFDLTFPEIDVPKTQINTSWYKADNKPAVADYSVTGKEVPGVNNNELREVLREQGSTEQRLMTQMIELLQTIAGKDTNISMDSRSLVSGLSTRERRNGYNFRLA